MVHAGVLAELATPPTRITAWSNGGVLSWEIEGVTEECEPDELAAAIQKRIKRRSR